nr:expressed protein [Hymenolepis microstoma]
MAEGNDEEDFFVLELTVPPFENEFEEEKLREDCEDAFLEFRTTEVGTCEWAKLKNIVLAYRNYLQEKAEYLEHVKNDRKSCMEPYKRWLEVMERLNAIEKEAIEKKQSTSTSTEH